MDGMAEERINLLTDSTVHAIGMPREGVAQRSRRKEVCSRWFGLVGCTGQITKTKTQSKNKKVDQRAKVHKRNTDINRKEKKHKSTWFALVWYGEVRCEAWVGVWRRRTQRKSGEIGMLVRSLDTKERGGECKNKGNLPDQRGSSCSSSPWTMEWYIVISACVWVKVCVA